MTLTLTARWVFPVASPPLANGVVAIDGGRIVAVEPGGSRKADRDLGDVAVIPGLVNAHTHLDLTAMRGVAPPRLPLPEWLGDVIAHRRKATREETLAAILAGMAECARAGTTLVGDISAGGLSWEVLAASGIRATVYHELIGMSEDRAREAWDDFRDWLDSRSEQPRCRPGASPHAPYSAGRWVYGTAMQFGGPLATHLAESCEEMELLAHRSGPFVEFLRRLGAWDPEEMIQNPAHVLPGIDDDTLLVIAHGNYLPPDAPIPTNATIVYCPRTHAAFGHPPHPFRDFLARGVRVALGTDGLASNPDLNLLSEARFVRARYPDLPGATILRMATLSGAEALGWGEVTGSLEVGKSADLVAIPLHGRDADDPHELFLASDARLSAVMCEGRWVV